MLEYLCFRPGLYAWITFNITQGWMELYVLERKPSKYEACRLSPLNFPAVCSTQLAGLAVGPQSSVLRLWGKNSYYRDSQDRSAIPNIMEDDERCCPDSYQFHENPFT